MAHECEFCGERATRVAYWQMDNGTLQRQFACDDCADEIPPDAYLAAICETERFGVDWYTIFCDKCYYLGEGLADSTDAGIACANCCDGSEWKPDEEESVSCDTPDEIEWMSPDDPMRYL